MRTRRGWWRLMLCAAVAATSFCLGAIVATPPRMPSIPAQGTLLNPAQGTLPDKFRVELSPAEVFEMRMDERSRVLIRFLQSKQ